MRRSIKRAVAAFAAAAMVIASVTVTSSSKLSKVEAKTGRTVTLDPGHGGYDGGASGNGVQEKNCNLKIAQYCKAYIEANSDIKVYMTRSDDTFVGLYDRPEIAYKNNSDLLVSIHNNSSTNSGAHGAEIWIPRTFFNSEMTVFGKDVVNNISSATGVSINGAGVKTRDCTNNDIYKLDADGRPCGILNPVDDAAEYAAYGGEKSSRVLADYYGIICGGVSRNIPSVIIEHAFVSNASDAAKLANESMLKAFGEADAKAIIKYFDSGVKENDSITVGDPVSTFDTNTTFAYAMYKPYCQTYGERNWRYQGETAGVTGHSTRLEALTLKFGNVPASTTLSMKASVYKKGYVTKSGNAATGVTIGTAGSANILESITITMGDVPGYKLKYRVHMQTYGWLDWVESGTETGYPGSGKRIEAIEIMYEDIPVYSGTDIGIGYKTHVQTYGWQTYKVDGETAGTTGEAKRMEAIKLYMYNAPEGASITARAHIQTYGWKDYDIGTCGTIGTTGEAKRIEAIALTLNNCPGYVIEYRVHCQTYGWTKWYSQGEIAGTSGMAKRLEAVEIRIVPESEAQEDMYVTYRSHVQTYSWLDWVSENSLSGTEGQAKRMEAINISLHNAPEGVYISGKVHCQTYGWLYYDKIDSDTLLGTTGEAKRIEAINLKLNGTSKYKLQYRVHVQTYGWTDWIDEGNTAGTEGQCKRLEAIQIRIVEK